MKLIILTILVSCLVVFVSSQLDLAPQSFRNDVVKRHNELRAKHNVGEVTENIEISMYAQEWANYLGMVDKLLHRSQEELRQKGYGENLALNWNISSTGKDYVDQLYTHEEQFYRENKYYNKEPDMNNYSEFAHFTQIVWKNSKEIGIGIGFGRIGGYIVINYKPAGNVPGQYSTNVFPPNVRRNVADIRKYLFLLKA